MAPVIKTRGLSRNYVVGRDGVISSDSPTTRGVMV